MTAKGQTRHFEYALDSSGQSQCADFVGNQRITPPSSLLFGDLVEDRLPRLLLLVNERRGFGGRHRIGIAAERCKLLFQFRLERDFAQVCARPYSR
jgi:hypothetical protein